MILTNGNIWTAGTAIRQAQRRHLDIPQLGKYRLARLEKDLEKDYRRIESARIALIQQHGTETFSDETQTKSNGWSIQEGTAAHKAYTEAWDALCLETCDVKVAPIPLAALGDSANGLELGELSALGVLIEE